MAQFDFDTGSVEKRENSYELLPAGFYTAQVTESEIVPLKSGNGQALPALQHRSGACIRTRISTPPPRERALAGYSSGAGSTRPAWYSAEAARLVTCWAGGALIGPAGRGSAQVKNPAGCGVFGRT